MRRHHRLPFGAELVGGGVRFRLWAPGATHVDVVLDADGTVHPMQALDDGWFE